MKEEEVLHIEAYGVASRSHRTYIFDKDPVSEYFGFNGGKRRIFYTDFETLNLSDEEYERLRAQQIREEEEEEEEEV